MSGPRRRPVVLGFHHLPKEQLDRAAREGLGGEAPVRLYRKLRKAPDRHATVVVKLDDVRSDGNGVPSRGKLEVPHVPASRLLNVKPYRKPVSVTAGGGCLMREGEAGAEVLMIFRRGVWDLPKGKKEKKEDVHACAVREVTEEIGAADVRIIRPLAKTVHAYPLNKRYAIKTTHWFEMDGSGPFVPQADEGIERVVWVPVEEAIRRVPYETLRQVLREVGASGV